MGKFEFYQDVKMTVWERRQFSVEAENLEEAKKIVVKEGDIIDLEFSSETLYETMEQISPEENQHNPTVEFYVKGEKEPFATNVEEKKCKVSYVLGTEAVREYQDAIENGKRWNVSSLCDCGSVCVGEFHTQAELEAYKQGIADATGWLESEQIMTDEEWNNYLSEYFEISGD